MAVGYQIWLYLSLLVWVLLLVFGSLTLLSYQKKKKETDKPTSSSDSSSSSSSCSSESSPSSSSSSSSSEEEKYDVFLSFRGEDTRCVFIGHLYEALRKKGIHTYIDEEDLKSGDEISPMLMKAIEESKICIIVLSQNFASSTWCLDELVQILKCKRNKNVIPIFYGIDPSIVRKQKDSYAKAFANHEGRFRDNKMEKVKQWRGALKEVADRSGYDSKNFRNDCKLVNKVVEDILLKLPKYQLTNCAHLIGIEKPVKEIESLLSIGSMDVRIIGIWGMGGIGKTTLAGIVFQRFSDSHFDAYCFLEDISVEANNAYDLRHTLLFELLEDKNLLCTSTPSVGSRFIQDRFRSKKVFIVLDNLSGRRSKLQDIFEGYQFANGSRIIVTSRDKQLLKTMAQQIYELKGLDYQDALQLFSFHAFGPNSLATGYEALIESIAHYAKGNPLALKVLGSSLKSKSIKEWESALEKLKTDGDPDIQKVLRISFDGLNDKGIQGIFLDLACFFTNGVDREFVQSILNRTEHSDAAIGISALIDKSLLKEEWQWIMQYPLERVVVLEMHDLLRQMAKRIVFYENKDSGNRSRLWNVKDVCHILERNTGTSTIEGILLNLKNLKKDVKVSPTAFSKMDNLRILKIVHFYGDTHNDRCIYTHKGYYIEERVHERLHCPNGLKSFVSDEITYFHWDFYPLKYLPEFSTENLVVLIMRESQLELLWNEDEPLELEKLKVVDLSYSKHLIQIPNLSRAINLQDIRLHGCTSLVHIPPFFRNLNKLRYLNMANCKNLEDGIENLPNSLRDLTMDGTAIKSLPESIWESKYLKKLALERCTNLRKISEISNHMECLVGIFLVGTEIEELPESIGNVTALERLYLRECHKIKFLPNSLCKLLHLQELELKGCSSLEELPPLPHDLLMLDMDGTAIKSLPESIWELKYLERLSLVRCKNLRKISEISNHMECLVGINFRETGIEELPESIENLTALEWLDLRECHKIKFLPNSVCKLLHLQELKLKGCSSLEELPPLPHGLKMLDMYGTAIKSLPESIWELKYLEKLHLFCCTNLRKISEISNHMEHLVEIFLGDTEIEELPESIENLTALKRLDLRECHKIKFLPNSLCKLLSLQRLELDGCSSLEELPPLPHGLGRLVIRKCERLKSIAELPSSVRSLQAHDCRSLETISSRESPPFYYYLFTNCLKLDEDTRNNIIVDLERRFSSPWRDNEMSFPFIVYPGDEIPKCFRYQTDDGNSVNIRLPQNWFKVPLWSFACCIVLCELNKRTDYRFLDFEFKLNFKTSFDVTSNGFFPVNYFLDKPGTIDSDHVFIFPSRTFFPDLSRMFGPNWSSICSNITEASFRVSSRDGLMVQKCGFEFRNANKGFEEQNVDRSSSNQPNGRKHNGDSLPHNNSKRIKLM